MAMDAAEFRRLVEEHQRMVFSIALRVAGEYGTAEEVAQDVFLELFRSSERLEGPDHVRFWLRRVTVHRATDALRKQARQPEAAAEEWMDEAHSPAAGNGHDGAGFPNSGPASYAIAARLEELLRGLPENLRVPVVLRYQEEMTPEEIARLLGQPLNTVKSNLQRGLQMMRRKAEITMKEYVRHG
jgi:RNA polymerase sigma-70 factor (ECF subfamily)